MLIFNVLFQIAHIAPMLGQRRNVTMLTQITLRWHRPIILMFFADPTLIQYHIQCNVVVGLEWGVSIIWLRGLFYQWFQLVICHKFVTFTSSSSSIKSLLYVPFRHKWSFKWQCNTMKTLEFMRWMMYRWWCEGGGDRAWWVIENNM